MALTKKFLIFMIFFVLLTLISSCRGKNVEKSIEELRTGTQGIILNFLPNNPPAMIHVDKSHDKNNFEVILELKNLGAFPQPETRIGGPKGKVYLSGYDPAIITDVKAKDNSDDLERRALEGKSMINLNGGSDLAFFTGRIDYEKLNVERYDLTLQATACYEYETIAGPTICIEPNPYSTIQEKKICEVSDTQLSGQGAPVAVTKIEEEAFERKTQFKITIKNVGNGDVLKVDAFEKCDPYGTKKLERDDIDKVYLQEVKIADNQLQCRPFATDPVTSTSGYIRLINGEGSIICELSKDIYPNYERSKTAFTTPLTIRLNYFYKNTAQRNLQIKKEAEDFS